jgi:hypothetical protein
MPFKRKKGTYYDRNRDEILRKTNRRYAVNKKYRENARKRAKKRYHIDENYRIKTIRNAKARYRRIKRKKNSKK